MTADHASSPNPVDIHVGGRVRLRRKVVGITQERLAEALGITVPQVQKYKRGSNRVSASKLYAIACVLSVPMAFFFDGLADPVDDDWGQDDRYGSDRSVIGFLRTSEGLELAKLFPHVRANPVRQQILNLVLAMAESSEEA